MTHPVLGIDHVFLLVQDLDDAAARYGALGFTLSPRGVHSATKGTANHTIMLRDDYFELLGIINDTPANAHRRAMLEQQGEGLYAIACRIGDAREGAAALQALGIATGPVGDFERPVDLADGTVGRAAFSTMEFAADQRPFGTVFMCQHHTRDTVWLPELLEHANTATGLAGVLAISDDPLADAQAFARLWAAGQVTPVEGGAVVTTGVNSAPLTLLSRDALQAMWPEVDLSCTARGVFTALQIRVEDLAAVLACLEKAGISAIRTPRGVAVHPADACGMVLEFVV